MKKGSGRGAMGFRGKAGHKETQDIIQVDRWRCMGSYNVRMVQVKGQPAKAGCQEAACDDERFEVTFKRGVQTRTRPSSARRSARGACRRGSGRGDRQEG